MADTGCNHAAPCLWYEGYTMDERSLGRDIFAGLRRKKREMPLQEILLPPE